MSETRFIPRKQAGTPAMGDHSSQGTRLLAGVPLEDRTVLRVLQVEWNWIDGTLWGGQDIQARETA